MTIFMIFSIFLISVAVKFAESQHENLELLRVSLFTRPGLKGIGTVLTIDRCENLPDEFNDRISSVRTNDCVMVYADYCCQGMAVQVYGSEDLSNSPIDRRVSSVSPCGHYRGAIPKEIIETWDGHNDFMSQVAETADQDVALYHSDSVIRSGEIVIHMNFIDKVWKYTKHLYGNFGPEGGPLFAFFHANSLPLGATGRLFFDGDSKCRNTIDVYSESPTAWSGPLSDGEKDMIIRSVGRIVEWANKGVYYNPAWGDNVWGFDINTLPWKEIFTFDVYNGLGMETDAKRTFELYMNSSHDKPHANTFWFKNWFFPIYDKYGGSRVLNNYFETLARHFPRRWYELEWRYDRLMNLGEFVHIFSGAVGMNLVTQARVAFDWTSAHDNEFSQAQIDFPNVRYNF